MDNVGELNPYVLFYDALLMGQGKLTGTPHHLYQVKLCLLKLKEHIESLRYDIIHIKDIKIWHVKNILERANMTPSVFNHSRSYLLSIFKELIQYGCIEHNPCKEIIKKKIVKRSGKQCPIINLDMLKIILKNITLTSIGILRFSLCPGAGPLK